MKGRQVLDGLHNVPGDLRAMLAAADGPVQAPVRSEIFGPQRFAQHGRSLGETHRAGLGERGANSFFPRFRSNIVMLRAAHRYICTQAASGYDISPAAEWLLDNFHRIEAQLEAIRTGLPNGYFRTLPVLLDEPLAGLPRVYGVSWAFVAHTDGAFDADLLVHFLMAYEETRELTLGEMWALPTTLRVVMIENLRRLAERVATHKAAREVANLCCDQIESLSVPALQRLYGSLEARGIGTLYLAQMAQRWQDPGATPALRHAQRQHDWVLRTLPADLARIQAQQIVDQAADNLSVGNTLMSLRAIDDASWPDIVSSASTLMRLMLTAPAFEADHASTRDQTLHGIEQLARQNRLSELVVARALLGLMADPAAAATAEHATVSDQGMPVHWLRGPGRPALLAALDLAPETGLASRWVWMAALRRAALPLYLGAMALLTAGLMAWLLLRHGAADGWTHGLGLLAALMLLFPASEAAQAVIHRLISESTQPRPLPRLAFANGIPAAHRVLVVIPAMLTDAASTRELVRRLQLHQLANPEPHAQFALLTDWADADHATLPGDAALLADAVQQIEALNAVHAPLAPLGAAATSVLSAASAAPAISAASAAPTACGAFAASGATAGAVHSASQSASAQAPLPDPAALAPRFLVLHRARSFSQTEQRWIGWERKRGKLEALVDLLATGVAGAFLDLADTSRCAAGLRYIVTLDSDTQLPPGRLRDLVGVAAHPHNQPRLGADGRTVVSGYGILQPRIQTPLPDASSATPYHALFAGQCGIDPYSAASSEVFQDLFAEGSFTGKGLLNVTAFHATLSGRLPEGRVLSHDLLEGALARCAAVSDIPLIEDSAHNAEVAAARLHRWMRGDWQLLAVAFSPLRAYLRPVNRWKMLDNLRRSLVAPLSLGGLLLALAGHGVSPWAALLLVAAAYTAGPLMGALAGFIAGRVDLAWRHFYRGAALELARALGGGLWHLALLLREALMAIDAIVRALYRLLISHRHLLQWVTAASAQAAARTGWRRMARQHRGSTAVALALGAGLWWFGTPQPLLAGALCCAWALSSVWSGWASRPMRLDEQAALRDVDRALLDGIARDTWRFFERCIGPDDRHLPPDNLQTRPHDILARRTSPTNIGLYLLSCACARRFGWIGTVDLIQRLEATLTSLATLERHRGHFLNWYDTGTGQPLLPRYVSTVDSGNLCGHLLTVAQACRELALNPYDPAPGRQALQRARARLQLLLARRGERTGPYRERLVWALCDLRATRRSVALDEASQVGAGSVAASTHLLAIAERCEALAMEAEFGFLYHRTRQLLHIGFRLAEQELDAGFYDLLASEARLTSLFAIGKGDLPVTHWAALGRPFFAVSARAGLRSWSGSMFEYLMPSLVVAEPQGSVLRDAGRVAIDEQIAFAEHLHVPWGISESAYADQDHTLAYQYAPHGVPRLALRRTPPDELVVAPYATALAVPYAPRRACANFRALQALSARGRYGFIEALDYSPAHRAGPARYTAVQTYMAHHQGMSIVALAGTLLDGAPLRWGMAAPLIEAVSSLLHERPPRAVSNPAIPPTNPLPHVLGQRASSMVREVLPGSRAVEPTHLLSNGRYAVALRPNGAGWSRRDAVGITRSRDDVLRDEHGHFLWLRRPGRPQLASLTQHPGPDPSAHYRSVFHADRVVFEASWVDLSVHTTAWVSPEDDIEFRQVVLTNDGDRAMELTVYSAFEVTLTDPRADEAHPAFTNLFVSAHWLAAQQALVFARRPRLAGEVVLHAAHFLAGGDPQVLDVQIQTDRRAWLGRNRAASQPLGQVEWPPEAGSEARVPFADISANAAAIAQAQAPAMALVTGLDPVAVLAVRLRIAPRGKACLTFATAACEQAATLMAVIDKYRLPGNVERASLMSATLTSIRLRAMRLTAENHASIQTLTTALVLGLSRPHGGAASFADPAGAGSPAPVDAAAAAIALPPGTGPSDRRLLWRFGLSGERPIILVSAASLQGLGLLRTLAQALRVWSWGGVACDLVVVNAEPSSYQMALQREIGELRERLSATPPSEEGRGTADLAVLHLLRADEVSARELATLQRLACVRLQADGRPLQAHLQTWHAQHEHALQAREAVSRVPVRLAARNTPDGAPPLGAFAAGSGAFSFEVSARRRPQRPWINVLANESFGTQVSEAGGGCSWAGNSRLNQLSAWGNDPVADTPGEWFLLQDLRSQEVWSLSAAAQGDAAAVYRVEHAPGQTVVTHRRGDLLVRVQWCVDAALAVKQVQVQVSNQGPRVSELRLVGLVEWIVGSQRSDRHGLHTRHFSQRLSGDKLTALLATQDEQSGGFGEGTAFFGLVGGAGVAEDWTCDRRECFDAEGRLVLPDHFGMRQGVGLDPCAALSMRLLIPPGDRRSAVFLLGWAETPGAARLLATRAAGIPAEERLSQALSAWDALLGATEVDTPDPLFNALVNRWLLYQAVACRLWAKAGFYQAGGATGFRDQLQDTMALTWAAPALLRAQIVRCAGRQFVEGDVQHWWHAPTGAGVRTHFSDDLLWLASACVRYVSQTGDRSVLDETVAFLSSPPIPDGAEDLYDTPTVSDESASVYEHAARALDHSLRSGEHGLPLMGTGDWNDGMNRVGHGGRGESVWLAWFLIGLVADFAPLARNRGEGARADQWESHAQSWRTALETQAWDDDWYVRAFFDNGEPLGSHRNDEARIDLIAQAWSVLSGAAPLARQREAMASAEALLMDSDAGLIRLLDPPLQQAEPSAGYIQAYPPGVRENGGQYSHAGVWALMAQAELALQARRGRASAGSGLTAGGAADACSAEAAYPADATDAADAADAADAVYRSFTWLSPAHRHAHPTQGAVYELEPYAVAGDVYSHAPYVGRGGWSWYTGAAAWLHRAAIESLFGLRLTATQLSFSPCLPSHWPEATLRLRRQGRTLTFHFVREAQARSARLAADPAACALALGEPLALGEALALGDVAQGGVAQGGVAQSGLAPLGDAPALGETLALGDASPPGEARARRRPGASGCYVLPMAALPVGHGAVPNRPLAGADLPSA